MFNLIKRLLLFFFILGFACFSVFTQWNPVLPRLRINDFSLFFDDERIVLRGTSDYHYLSDPLIYSELFPDNFTILIAGSGNTRSNFLRIWMEGYSNTSGLWKAGDDPHPIFGTISYPDYGKREQQPFKCLNYLGQDVNPVDYEYDLRFWPDWYDDDIPAYEDRLLDIISEARDNNVIVMITLFDSCLKDNDACWKCSAWNPDNNDSVQGEPGTAGFLLEGMSPYPLSINLQSNYAFYDIWEWNGNTIYFNTLNHMGELQEGYVKRVAGSIPAEYWNVIFEIENEPKPVIADTSQGDINLSARWSHQVAKWIKKERPSSLIAFNAHGDPAIRRDLLTLDQGLVKLIDIISIHASCNAGTNDHWQLDNPQDYPSYSDWENAQKIHIKNALDRIRDDNLLQNLQNLQRFYIIDSDGDSGNLYDNTAARVKQIAGIASIFGAGYNNKYCSIDDYDDPQFDPLLMVQFNNKINERFFDESQGWKYGKYANQDPSYSRNYFDNNAIRCEEPHPIIRTKNSEYSLTFNVINNGTNDDMQYDPPNTVYNLYDINTKKRVDITKTLNKVYNPWDWTIPISELDNSHKDYVTMNFEASSEDSITHELVIEKQTGPYLREIIGGDVLYVTVIFQ